MLDNNLVNTLAARRDELVMNLDLDTPRIEMVAEIDWINNEITRLFNEAKTPAKKSLVQKIFGK